MTWEQFLTTFRRLKIFSGNPHFHISEQKRFVTLSSVLHCHVWGSKSLESGLEIFLPSMSSVSLFEYSFCYLKETSAQVDFWWFFCKASTFFSILEYYVHDSISLQWKTKLVWTNAMTAYFAFLQHRSKPTSPATMNC